MLCSLSSLQYPSGAGSLQKYVVQQMWLVLTRLTRRGRIGRWRGALQGFLSLNLGRWAVGGQTVRFAHILMWQTRFTYHKPWPTMPPQMLGWKTTFLHSSRGGAPRVSPEVLQTSCEFNCGPLYRSVSHITLPNRDGHHIPFQQERDTIGLLARLLCT